VSDVRGVDIGTKSGISACGSGFASRYECIQELFDPPDMHTAVLKGGFVPEKRERKQKMKGFFSDFKASAKELQSVKCLVICGLMTGLFVILDMNSIKIGSFLKLNTAFLALAVIGMLFGPCPAMIAAAAGDFIGCIVSGQAPFPLLTLTAILEGFVFGALLYKKEDFRLVIMAITARLIDSFVINLLLNTAILMSAGFMSATKEQFAVRVTAISGQALVYCFLIAGVLPAVLVIYRRIFGKAQSRSV